MLVYLGDKRIKFNNMNCVYGTNYDANKYYINLEEYGITNGFVTIQ